MPEKQQRTQWNCKIFWKDNKLDKSFIRFTKKKKRGLTEIKEKMKRGDTADTT